MHCYLCFRPPPGTTAITAKDLCDEHNAMMAGADENRRQHEEHGGCWDGCGCISLEELDRQLAWAAQQSPSDVGGE